MQYFGCVPKHKYMHKKTRHYTFRRFLFLVIVAGLLPPACQFIEFRPDDQLLAEVYGNRLYVEDIQGVIPAGVTAGDSAAMVKRYVDRWVDQQVYTHHASEYATLEDRSIEQRVDDYRNALIIHAFEQAIVKNELDTVVTEEEISAYWEENSVHFRVRNHIVAVNFVKLPLNAPGTNQIRSLYRSASDNNVSQLQDLALEHAASYQINPDQLDCL